MIKLYITIDSLKSEEHGNLSHKQLENTVHIFKNAHSLDTQLETIIDSDTISEKQVNLNLMEITLSQFLNKSEACFDEILAINSNNLIINSQITDQEDIQLYIDPIRATQVFVNLLKNAASYSPYGSKIELQIKKLSNSIVRLSVIDDGLGIAMEKQDKIFDEKHPSNPHRETDLVKSKFLIERMQGSIGFESQEGKGSEFWVDFSI